MVMVMGMAMVLLHPYVPPGYTRGGWSGWSSWSPCNVICGGGIKYRYRRCNNPVPNDGLYCYGSQVVQTTACNTNGCRVDGNWGCWQSWKECTKSCGVGTKARSRACNNPPPANGGASCGGVVTDISSCNDGPCPVHGDWGNWTEWSQCLSRRNRSCDNPSPLYGGLTCSGLSDELSDCFIEKCSTDCYSSAVLAGVSTAMAVFSAACVILACFVWKRRTLSSTQERPHMSNTYDKFRHSDQRPYEFAENKESIAVISKNRNLKRPTKKTKETKKTLDTELPMDEYESYCEEPKSAYDNKTYNKEELSRDTAPEWNRPQSERVYENLKLVN